MSIRCEGLPTGPCPDSRFDATVKLGIGDLMLCQKCDSTRRDEEVLMRQNLTTNATKDCSKQSVSRDLAKSTKNDTAKPVSTNAVSTIIVNEVLNFLKNSYVTSTCGQLKPVLISFYNEEELPNAKNILYKSLSDADVGDLPRLITRKGDQKIKMIVDDLLELFVIVDERKLLSKLPRFVADNLARIPTVCQDNLNSVALARKMELLENRVAMLAELESRVQQLEHRATTTIAKVNCPDRGGKQHQVDCVIDDAQTEVITATGSNFSVDASPDYATVASRNRRGFRSSREQQSKQLPKKTNSKRILGEGAAGEHGNLQSAVQIKRKAVFHVDNLEPTSTTTTVEDHLKKLGIPVLTCFNAKSWMRDDEREQVTAFRVCIPAEYRDRFMDKMSWPKGILITVWKFKTNNNQ